MSERSGQSSVRVIDLFAGPGGWDVGASYLGIAPLGIEWDESACKTREAAGLATLKGDVSNLSPKFVASFVIDGCDGLIASPPCQSFSMAGKRGGERDTEHVIACAHEIVAGNDTRAEHGEKCEDPRSMLVVEPLRWVRDLRPRWVALEQVPPVLGLWTLFAQLMHGWGYRTWVGVLSAERYGVPQTRKRAILLASLDFQPHPPEPTHQAYVPGEPQRHEVTMFGEVLPWISMAEALGWAESAVALRAGTNANDVERPADAPSRFSERMNDVSWVTHYDHIPWTTERPSTTLAGDPRVFSPGGHIAHDGRDNSKMVGRSEDAIRVSVQEASILQSFPPDYPWQGSRSAQFQQIGNAVPPLLACAVLRQLTQDRVPVTTGIEAA